MAQRCGKRVTWSQFPPEPKIEEEMATMWSLSLFTLPHAPRPTSKKVPWMSQRGERVRKECDKGTVRTRPECVTRFSSISGDAGAGAVKAGPTRARARARYVNGVIAISWAQSGARGGLKRKDLPHSGDEDKERGDSSSTTT